MALESHSFTCFSPPSNAEKQRRLSDNPPQSSGNVFSLRATFRLSVLETKKYLNLTGHVLLSDDQVKNRALAKVPHR
jgi:hypothetical protein